MSRKLPQLVVPLIAALPFVGCSQSDAPSVPNDPATRPQVVTSTDDESLGPEELPYVLCEEDEAETILEIRITVPNVMDNYPFEMPLCRRKTLTGLHSMHFAADGVSPDGFGIGYAGYYTIDDATETNVDVSFSLYWTAADRTRGSFDELLRVTVGQPSVKELDGSIEIRWTFRDPVPVMEVGNGSAT